MCLQLAFDFSAPLPVADPSAAPAPDRAAHVHVPATGNAELDRRRARGACGHLAGLSAEARIAQDYERRGYRLAGQRWRGRSGEIDLILRDGDGLIFVEVKKSRSFDRALERLSSRQIRRLMKAAEEYVGQEPRGSLTDMRFDVALMDAHGMIRVLENAFLS
ncbi:MAG: YraN family protein [Rhodobacteraceae bacterium]|nr:YraN family protein [Paracoccaceae bacterium]